MKGGGKHELREKQHVLIFISLTKWRETILGVNSFFFFWLMFERSLPMVTHLTALKNNFKVFWDKNDPKRMCLY